MNAAELHAAVLGSILATDPSHVQFDPITILILSAILTSAIGHYVEKCLNHVDPKVLRNPSWYERRRLGLQVAIACRAATQTKAARQAGLGSIAIYRRYSGLVQEHFLLVARRIGERGLPVRLTPI